MSNDINVLGSLLRQLQQGSGGPSGYGVSPLQGSASAGQILPPTLAGGDSDGDNDNSSTSAAPVAASQLPSQKFSASILQQLLASQQTQNAPPSSTDIANKLISSLDGNSDGNLSLAEVEKALGVDPSSSSSSTSSTDPLSQLTAAFNKLDTNGDGQLSTSELATAIDQKRAQGDVRFPPPAPPSSSDIAQSLLSAVDTNGDGSLSLAEIEKALGVDPSSASSSAATTAAATTDPLAQLTSAFNQIDTNGDGQLSTAELTTALDKARSSGVHHHHHHHHAYQSAQALADAAAAAGATTTTTTSSLSTSSTTTPSTTTPSTSGSTSTTA